MILTEGVGVVPADCTVMLIWALPAGALNRDCIIEDGIEAFRGIAGLLLDGGGGSGGLPPIEGPDWASEGDNPRLAKSGGVPPGKDGRLPGCDTAR